MSRNPWPEFLAERARWRTIDEGLRVPRLSLMTDPHRGRIWAGVSVGLILSLLALAMLFPHGAVTP